MFRGRDFSHLWRWNVKEWSNPYSAAVTFLDTPWLKTGFEGVGGRGKGRARGGVEERGDECLREGTILNFRQHSGVSKRPQKEKGRNEPFRILEQLLKTRTGLKCFVKTDFEKLLLLLLLLLRKCTLKGTGTKMSWNTCPVMKRPRHFARTILSKPKQSCLQSVDVYI